MDQIGIKLPKSEIKFLEWFSKKNAVSKAGAYREATLDAFKNWKIKILLNEYQEGRISFKEMCDLGSFTLLEGMNIIEMNEIEPPITDLIEDYSTNLTEENILTPSSTLTKNKTPLKRKSKEII